MQTNTALVIALLVFTVVNRCDAGWSWVGHVAKWIVIAGKDERTEALKAVRDMSNEDFEELTRELDMKA